MKQKLLLLIPVFISCLCSFAQKREQMVFENDFKEASSGLGNITSMFMTEDGWWNDANGDDAAVLRIKVVDMSVNEMKRLKVKGSPNLGLGKQQFFEKEQQWFVAVSAGSNMYLEMIHPTYGTSSRLNISQRLKAKTIYDVTLRNNRTTTIAVRSLPDGADVYIDGDKKGQTPCEIAGQRFGHHTLKLLYEGNSLIQEIEVEEGHTVFDKFDFRTRTKVDITSDPKGAAIYVDGELIGKAPIHGYNMILGAHTFKAELNATQIDEQSINITEQTTIVDLHPVKKGNVQIITKYSGRPVAATLVVDNEKSYTGNETYNVTLPYNHHTFRVSYGGRTKEKTIKVNKPEMNHTFKLSAKNDIVWPWKREYDQRPVGLSFGYVSKQIVSKNGNARYKFDPGYFRENKKLHGMQMGIHFQPTLSWGGGLYSGLFYELYMANCDDYGEEIQHFTEHALNIPVHLYYRLAFAKKFSLALHGGLGMDIGLYALYKQDRFGDTDSEDGYETEYTDYYGKENGGPNRFNLTWDVAGTINIKNMAITAFMSRGLIHHKGLGEWDDGGGKNLINKWGVSISYLFGSN